MTSGTRTLRTRQAGFTLIEVLLATTITTAIMGSIVLVTGQLSRSYYSQLDGAAVQQEGRFALDWIVRTLVTAGSNPTALLLTPCPAAATSVTAIRRDPDGNNIHNDIRIQSDLNGNGLFGGLATGTCTEPDEDITIKLGTLDTNLVGSITKQDNNVGGGAVDMTDQVISALTFTYLNCNRVATTDNNDICYVGVSLTSRTPTINNNTGQRASYTNSAEVRVRTR